MSTSAKIVSLEQERNLNGVISLLQYCLGEIDVPKVSPTAALCIHLAINELRQAAESSGPNGSSH